ncbi:MAG: twin-arginine translocase TatA/TatE family subunit [Candidatus Dormibacteraceae bacterium]
MDLGFHPLYVIILLALALIVFGPSRLPKMGAQVGKMMREFQSAREGLTQQVRDAFEEQPTTEPAVEDEPETAALPAGDEDATSVAVLEAPPVDASEPVPAEPVPAEPAPLEALPTESAEAAPMPDVTPLDTAPAASPEDGAAQK